MKKQIAADEPLDYVEFRISPDDRYYVFICSGDKEEKIGSSLIGQLTAHLRKELYSDSEGSYADFKLELPENLSDTTWFTKTTLIRFLELTDSPDALKKIFAISNEMLQLEETKKFHLSLHRQEKLYRNNVMNNEADNCNSNGSVQTPKEESDSSDNSKNELLRAMDLRLTALGDELVVAFKQAVGSTCSSEETLNLEKFCKHFGAADVSNVICKLLGMNLIAIVNDPPHDKNLPTECDLTANKVTINAQISKPSNIDQAVRYGASPAKAAELERQSSSESEDLSCSSEEEEVERPSAERSRNMARSATPRRSASPMRRIQIGRSGSRRTPAIAIKSLTYFPGRDKTFSASNDDESDRFELPTRAAESNTRRMSVQDAISLFERKQRDQTTEAPKWKSPADNPANAPKAVLRRWSSSVGETSAQRLDQDLPATSDDLQDEAPSAGVQSSTDILPCPSESEIAAKACVELETSKQSSPSPNDVEIPVTYSEGAGEKIDSAEWSRKKEAELNQMLSSFVQSKPSKYRSTQAADSKKLDSRTGQNKERKNQRLQGENTGKKTDKQTQSRTMPKAALDKAKPEISSSTIGKKQPVMVSKTQKEKLVKSMPLTSNSKRESLRPAVSKVPSKPSPLPATRKSWPLSTPTPRATGTLSSKTPIGGTPTSGISVPRQKSQSPASLSRSTPKPPETPQQKKKDVRNMQLETKKSSKSADENKRKVMPKSMITKKTGVAASVDTVPAKPTLTRKVAKKSSVVPLEPKPSIRKGSVASSKKAHTSPVKQPLSKPEVVAAENAVCIQENEVDANDVSEPVIEEVVQVEVVDLEPESHVTTPIATADVKKTFDQVPAKLVDESIERVMESSAGNEIQPEEESLISPLAWVENGLQDSPSTCQVAPPAAVESTNLAGSRVRHSLSQMLLEESSEPDIIEWGNAENPPAMVYQKDAPKGLKRLLKFARKSRGETTNIGSSPYASEGEDDGDESKGFGRKNSDNLLRKAALNATTQHGISSDGHERFLADSEPLSARSNASNSSFQSTTSTTSRASRSFFSLSAFRGNKGTETKMR